VFSQKNQQGVKFVVQPNVSPDFPHNHGLNLPVTQLFEDEIVPGEDPFGIGINDKDGFSQCVQKDTIGGLRPNPIDLQQPLPQGTQILGSHPVHIAMELTTEEVDESLEPACLQSVKTRRLYDPR
jgi:hypothetical protein